MTNEQGIGGTAVVNPSPSSGLKHSLRSATKAKAEALEDDALLKEEEKMMEEDEEVTSVEDNADATERTMLTVALVKSVVETVKADETASTDPSSPRYGLRKRRRASGQDLERLEHFQSTNAGGLARGSSAAAKGSSGGEQRNGDIAENVAETKPAPVQTPSQPEVQPPKPPTSQSTRQQSVSEPRRQPMADHDKPMGKRVLTSVPNPLSKPVHPPIVPGEKALPDQHASAVPPSVPCPLSGTSKSPALAPDSSDKRKVTINEPASGPSSGRKRGFSIDMDLALDFPDDTSGSAQTGRSRAFSFECFAFGINADEPLPPLEQSSGVVPVPGDSGASIAGRPRGDSIIFDPVSFQDGGIHEQNALDTPRGDAPPVEPPTLSTKPRTKATSSPSPLAAPSLGNGVRSAGTVPTGSAPVTTITATSVAGGTTFSMDLLNKDGRIGIYLPDARRARIARFHEKRSRRIWRKRIKYDCRKKLADSRPRIKGRFVKRSDTED